MEGLATLRENLRDKITCVCQHISALCTGILNHIFESNNICTAALNLTSEFRIVLVTWQTVLQWNKTEGADQHDKLKQRPTDYAVVVAIPPPRQNHAPADQTKLQRIFTILEPKHRERHVQPVFLLDYFHRQLPPV